MNTCAANSCIRGSSKCDIPHHHELVHQVAKVLEICAHPMGFRGAVRRPQHPRQVPGPDQPPPTAGIMPRFITGSSGHLCVLTCLVQERRQVKAVKYKGDWHLSSPKSLK